MSTYGELRAVYKSLCRSYRLAHSAGLTASCLDAALREALAACGQAIEDLDIDEAQKNALNDALVEEKLSLP